MIIGNKRYHKTSCNDSFAWAKEEFAGAPDGALFIADQLVHARGRQNRTWQTSTGQIMATILLKPKTTTSVWQNNYALNYLNMALCLGILTPLKSYGTTLKWPNDFYLKNKKLGGMLIEVVWENEQHPTGIILGFALNINNVFTKDNELFDSATSLCMQTNKNHSTTEVLQNLIVSLNQYYIAWLENNVDNIFKQWQQEQMLLDNAITVHDNNGNTIVGTFERVHQNGDATIKTANGPVTISLQTVSNITA